ncbi:MAG: DUF6088 family protein [Verrucomicrobiae bacterium]
MLKPSQSIEKSMLNRIYGHGRGSVFAPNEFLDLGSRRAVDLALHRLTAAGTIRRLTRGLYFFPKSHRLLGEVLPSVEAVSKALANRDQVKLQPFGAYAANLLGLSEQVPAKVVFLTNGPAKKVSLGKMVIELRPTTPRHMATAGRASGLVISALRYLGKSHMTSERLAHLRKVLSPGDQKRLLSDLPHAPAWMHGHLRAIAAD